MQVRELVVVIYPRRPDRRYRWILMDLSEKTSRSGEPDRSRSMSVNVSKGSPGVRQRSTRLAAALPVSHRDLNPGPLRRRPGQVQPHPIGCARSCCRNKLYLCSKGCSSSSTRSTPVPPASHVAHRGQDSNPPNLIAVPPRLFLLRGNRPCMLGQARYCRHRPTTPI